MSIIDGQRVNAAITNAALVSRLDAQTVAGSKTFTDKMIVSDTTQSTSKDVGSIVTDGGLGVEKNINAGGDIVSNTLLQLNGATSGFVKVQSPAAPTSYTLTLPPTAGTADYVLKTNGAGVTDWVAQAGGGGSANTTLSNLTAPTAINQDLIFAVSSSNTIKSGDNLVSGNSGQLNISTGDAPNGNSGTIQIRNGTTDNAGVPGNISIEAGTNLNTGARGSIFLNAANAILSTTNLVVSSGYGIDFSATANGSGTTASELLNDYERGTFTATLTATTGTITLVSTQDTMAYVKVGDKVTITGQIVVQSVSAPTGTLTLNGLPFTSAVGTELSTRTAMSVRGDALTATATTSLQGFILASANTATIEKFAAGAVSALAANVQAGSNFMISLTYFTA